MKLTPITHDPFAAPPAPAGQPRLTPVAGDPFAPVTVGNQFGTAASNVPAALAESVGGNLQAIGEQDSLSDLAQGVRRYQGAEGFDKVFAAGEVAAAAPGAVVDAVRGLISPDLYQQQRGAQGVVADVGEATADYWGKQRAPIPMPANPLDDPLHAATGFGAQALEGVVPSLITGVGVGALTRNPNLGAAAIIPQVQGTEYAQERRDGSAPQEARTLAGMKAAAEVIPEATVIGEITSYAGPRAIAALRAAGREAFQELQTQWLQDAIDHPKWTPQQRVQSALYAAGLGAVGGGAVGAAFPGGARETPPGAPAAQPTADPAMDAALRALGGETEVDGLQTETLQPEEIHAAAPPAERTPTLDDALMALAAQMKAQRAAPQANIDVDEQQLPVQAIEAAPPPAEQPQQPFPPPPPKGGIKAETLPIEEILAALPPPTWLGGEGIDAVEAVPEDITAAPPPQPRTEMEAALQALSDAVLVSQQRVGKPAEVEQLPIENIDAAPAPSDLPPKGGLQAATLPVENIEAAPPPTRAYVQPVAQPPRRDEPNLVPAPAPARVPENLNDGRILNETYRNGLGALANELEKGGGVSYVYNERGDITGRSSSVNPPWFQTFASQETVSVAAAKETVQKALAGKKLGDKQARLIRHMLDTVEDREGVLGDEFLNRTSAEAEAEARRQDMTLEDDFYPPDFDAEERAITELAAAAREVDAEVADAILDSQASDADVARQLQEVIDRGPESETSAGAPARDGGQGNQAQAQEPGRAGEADVAPGANAQDGPVVPQASAGSITDVGEKIGGARKDTSTTTGPRVAKPIAEDEPGPSWRKRFTVTQIAKSMRPGEKGRWAIYDSRSKDRLGQPRRIGDTYATKEEVEAIAPLAVVALKHTAIPGSTKNADGSYKYEIWRTVTERKRVKVVDREFDTRLEAMRYMADNAADILDVRTTFGEESLPRPDNVVRTGPQRRTGNVNGEDFRNTFGFRGVEFGNWEAQDERQAVMNHAYDALLDLADVMGVPAKAIGLNGELALAFGARGQGLVGARAHYERNYGVINLTKMSGAGALGHEWFHALDHYFGRQDGKSKRERVLNERGDKVFPTRASAEDDYASGGFRAMGSEVREELRAVYKRLIETMYRKAEQYVEDTQKADKFVGQTREDLRGKLLALRKDLSEQKDATYWKRNNKPATAEQLAEFDAIANSLIQGEALGVEMRAPTDGKKQRSMLGGYRMSNDAVDKLSAIYKAVRGRAGFDSTNRGGVMDDIVNAMRRYQQRLELLASAQQGESKTKQVPTSFAMEAKSLDQGRIGDYWSTPHEMAARAFQSFLEDRVADRGGQSDFLSYGTDYVLPTPWGWKRPYPEGKEREAINKAFDEFVATLQTRETEQGVAIYEGRDNYGEPTYTVEAPRRGSYGVDPRQYELFPAAQKRAHDAARAAAERLSAGRGQATILGNRIAAAFRERGHVSLIGQQVESLEDLAVLAQVYRDPRFETLRYFAVNADGKVVHQMGVTSRLPGAAYAVRTSVKDDQDAWAEWSEFLDAARAVGGTKVYLLHNHPSGNSAQSKADERLTKLFADTVTQEFPGLAFAGHVIINHQEFTTLDNDGQPTISRAPLTTKLEYDITVASQPFPMLGARISSPQHVAALAKMVEADESQLIVIGYGASDSGVTMVATVPLAGLTSKRSAIHLRRMAINSGSIRLFGVYRQPKSGAGSSPAGLQKSAEWAIERSLFMDIVMLDQKGDVDFSFGTRARPKSGSYELGREMRGLSVQESGDPYGDVQSYRARYKVVSEKAVDTLDAVLSPLGSVRVDRDEFGRFKGVSVSELPGRQDYLRRRYEALGMVARADEAARDISRGLQAADQATKQQVFEFLTTADAPPAMVKDANARRFALAAKKKIGEISDQLVAAGLLSEESREAHRDAYLPRMYLRYLLTESDYRLLGSGKRPSDMGYLRQRKDIPDEVRRIILGEIKDPGFLSAAAIARPARDLALLDWLGDIAQDTRWVAPNALVEWRGHRVTPRWLKAEALQLRAQARHYTSAEDARVTRELAARMDEAADSASELVAGDLLSDYRAIPDTPQYGRLRGLLVRAEIYEDIIGIRDMMPTQPGWAEKLLGYGGIGTTANQLWKLSKVALNPPGQVRNAISNAVLLQLSGVPFLKVPKYVHRAWRDVVTDGRYWQIGKKYGVTESTFTSQELFRFKRELLELQKNEGVLNTWGTLHLAFARVADTAGDVYQFMEALFKTAKIMHAIEEDGLGEADAALEAQRWMFDYSFVGRNTKYLRNAPVGMPFVTFYVKVAPRLVEVATSHPQRLIPWVALYYGWQYAVAAALDVDEDDIEKLKKALPEWLQERGHVIMLPYKDDAGRWQFVDLGYFMPWSMYTEAGSQLARGDVGKAVQTIGAFGGPLPDIIAAIKTGIDPFTDRPIVDSGDPPQRQLMSILNYMWTMAAPPFLTENGWLGKMRGAAQGALDANGDPAATGTQAMLRLVGLNTYAIEPEKSRAQNLRRMQFELRDVATRLRYEMKRTKDPERRQALREEYGAETKRRQELIRQYAQDSEISEKLR